MATAKWAPKRYAYTPELGDIVGASGSEPHTSGKARLPVVEYYEFGPRSESGIPSIRLPS